MEAACSEFAAPSLVWYCSQQRSFPTDAQYSCVGSKLLWDTWRTQQLYHCSSWRASLPGLLKEGLWIRSPYPCGSASENLHSMRKAMDGRDSNCF